MQHFLISYLFIIIKVQVPICFLKLETLSSVTYTLLLLLMVVVVFIQCCCCILFVFFNNRKMCIYFIADYA